MSVRNLLVIVVLCTAGSFGCSGSPTTVSVTQTTTTTTTTVVPQLTAGVIGTSPTGSGLASATLFTFLLATPPSGGVPPYTFSWNFGDGGAGAGSTPSHAYTDPGNFTATVIVTDTKGTTAQASAPVSIRSATGRWTATFSGVTLNSEAIDIVQNQAAVTATVNGTADGFASGTGSVSNPRTLSVSVTFAAGMPAPYALTYVGSLDATLLTWTGTVAGFIGCPCPFTATRPSAGDLGAASSPLFTLSPPSGKQTPARPR
jgi:hypothetical protein